MILFVVDARDGLTPLDQEVAKRLRYAKVPVMCVANKADNQKLDPQADEFYQLGRKVVAVSTRQNRGKDELCDAIAERLPPPTAEDEERPKRPSMKVAIVGRRNTGKSTLVNTLAQAERMIVSEVPGTTRDSVDVRFELDGKPFVAIDTPGFRRGKSIATDVDFYGTHRAQRSIRRADVVLAVLRRHAAHQQGGQAALRLHCPTVQALHVRGEQVGHAGRQHAHRKVGHLPARHVPHHVVRADRLHHRPDGQEREGHAEPRADALQASRGMRVDHAELNKLVRAAPGREPAARCIRTAGRRSITARRWPCSRPRWCCFATIPRRSRSSTSALSAGRLPRASAVRRSADQALPAARERTDQRDEIDATLSESVGTGHDNGAASEYTEELWVARPEARRAWWPGRMRPARRRGTCRPSPDFVRSNQDDHRSPQGNQARRISRRSSAGGGR